MTREEKKEKREKERKKERDTIQNIVASQNHERKPIEILELF